MTDAVYSHLGLHGVEADGERFRSGWPPRSPAVLSIESRSLTPGALDSSHGARQGAGLLADQLSPRLIQALEYAFLLHGRDSRKGSNVPVMAHLLGVCALVQHAGGDEDEAIAALLHDALEDKPTETSPAEIGRRFGPRVLALVQVATDTPPNYAGGEKPRWRERKTRYLEHVREVAPSDLRVTVADKVDNVRALISDYRRHGESLWTRFNAGKTDQLWYYQSAVAAYKAAGFKGPLLEELTRLVEQLVTAAA